MQVLMTFQHNQDVEEINLLQAEIEQETQQVLQKIAAQKRQSCKIIDAENIKALAEARSEAFKTKVMKEAEAYKEKCHIQADIEAQIIRENANTRLEVAKNKSQALIKEAQAEEKASAPMEGMRRHTEKMKLAEGLKNLASKGHMIVSDKNGQQVLDYYNQTLDLVGYR